MLYRGSYHNGFAPRDFEPAYPELWRGCVGAWCPSLGPTGGVLRDWSGRQYHGTLTNAAIGSVWANQQGHCLLLDGTDDHVNCGTSLDNNGEMAISAWINPSSTSAVAAIVGNSNNLGSLVDYALELGRTSGKLGWYQGAGGVASTADLAIDTWQHVIGVRSGSAGAWTIDLYINGVLDSSQALTQNPNGTSQQTSIGAYGDLPIVGYYAGKIDDILIYNRILKHQEISTLYSNGRGRGIAYSYQQPRGSLTPGDSSGASGGTFPGIAWRNLRRWRFVVNSGATGSWPVVR